VALSHSPIPLMSGSSEIRHSLPKPLPIFSEFPSLQAITTIFESFYDRIVLLKERPCSPCSSLFKHSFCRISWVSPPAPVDIVVPPPPVLFSYLPFFVDRFLTSNSGWHLPCPPALLSNLFVATYSLVLKQPLFLGYFRLTDIPKLTTHSTLSLIACLEGMFPWSFDVYRPFLRYRPFP